MALSGTLSTKYKGYTYRIDWSATQSVAGNYSDVKLVHKLVCDSGWDLYIASHTGSGTVAGGTVNYTAPKISTGGGTTTTLGTTTHRVAHNADGSKTGVAVSGVFNIKATIAGTYKASLSVSGKIDLNLIPRASYPSLVTWPHHTQNVGNFGDTISIHMNRESDAFTHTVRYAFGSLSGTIATGVENGTTWTIPLSFMDLIPNSTSGSGTIYVDTYNGSTKIGTHGCGFTAFVPDSVKPTCTVQVLDATNYQATYGNLVQSLSKLKVKVNGYQAYSSPVAAYAATANGKNYTAAEFTTGVLTNGGTTTVTATVTDKRGRKSAAASASFPVLDYTRPSITALSVHRCDADGTENDQGDHIKATLSAEITPLNNKNSAAYTLRWKKTDEAGYPSGQTFAFSVPSASKYNPVNLSHIFAADPDYSYDVEAEAKDDIHTTKRTTSASTGFSLMDWGADGTSIRFGGVAEEENTFRNDLTLRQAGNRYTFESGGESGKSGFVCMARIKLIETHADMPITFVLTRRKAESNMTVHARLHNPTADTSSVLSFRYEGSNYGAFLTQGGDANTWDLYVEKGIAADTITIQNWWMPKAMESLAEVTFPGGQVTTVPTPYWRAGPLVAESILDCFFPVGFVLILFSHADPNTMYPGSTWERIENRFLWACDENGDIGTVGGEKTHTLTVNEMPAHDHPSYSNTMIWNSSYGNIGYTSGTSMGSAGRLWEQGNVATNTGARGGGAAHNNMPPYIQVSIWRRTA